MIKTLPDWLRDLMRLTLECVCFFRGHCLDTYVLRNRQDWLTKESVEELWIQCLRCGQQKRVQNMAKKDGKTPEEAWIETL